MDHSKHSDASLLFASAHDDGAFRVLYDRYVDRIYRYHLKRCADQDAAWDLVAETFAQAWIVRRAFRDVTDGSAAPWLYGIARNVLLQSVRRQRLEDGARQRLGLLERSEAHEVVPDDSWLDGADEMLDGLSENQRRAVELRVLDDMSYEGIAGRLAITPETARMRVHRAFKTLRDQYLRIEGET